MRFASISIILLVLASSIIAADCISCEEMSGKPQARILTVNDDTSFTLDIYTYYENLSADVSRQPINDSIIIVELTNSTGLKELYKTYTDSNGTAHFDFSTWKNGCITFKVLYCPFCSPSSPECGFKACLNYSLIDSTANSTDDIDVGPGSYAAPLVQNEQRYLPAVDQLSYCPSPPPMASTPALCLPLLIVFSLLSGALYLTGRNPWAGFNIGGARVGKHMRYQARGRGFSLDLKSAIMSIASAAKEMQTNPDTGKRYGDEAKPRYFGYSMVKDLGATIAGGEAVGEGTQTGAGGQQVGAGKGGTRPGIVGAFRQASRLAQINRVRSAGARVDSKGTPIGVGGKGQSSEWSRGNTNTEFSRQWGIDLGLGLVRAVVSVLDSTWIMQISGVSLGAKLNEACSRSERDTSARAIADSERVADTYGRQIQAGSARIRDGNPDTDGSRTGVRGANFIELNTEGLGLPAGARAAATVTEGEGGQITITVHIAEGTGANARMTNYSMENGVVTGIERVTNPGGAGGPQVGVNFRLGADGTLVASGITTYTNPPAVEGQPAPPTQVQFQAVRREDGQITEVGNIVIQRGTDGQVTGMFDRNQPAAQAGQPGAQVAADSSQAQAINNLLANDGHNVSSLNGIPPLTAANMQSLVNGTMQQTNASLERTNQVYMEQYGLVQVTDRNLLGVSSEGETDSSGRIKSDTRGDYSIRVVDSNYTPDGQPSGITGLAAGTTITVQNDEYVSATGPSVGGAPGRDLLVRDRPIQSGDQTSYQTTIAGTNIVLDTNVSRGSPVDASAVREHMANFIPMVSQAVQSAQEYRALVETEAGRQFRESRPDFGAGLDTYLEERGRASTTFETTLRERGTDDDVARASGLLYSSASLGFMDITYSSEATRGQREYERAVRIAETTGDRRFDAADLETLSPRARAYADATAAVIGSNQPPTFENVERQMRSTISSIQDREHAALLLANSQDPTERAQGEQQIRDLHMVPPNYRPPAGTSLLDAAMQASIARGENYTADVVEDRVRANTANTMRAHPELVAPSGDPAVGTSVARHMLSLGTDLATLPDAEVRARVEARIAADPSIPPDDREAARRYVDNYLPQAREVARDFVAAETTTIREITSRPWEYIRSDADRGLQQMASDQYVRERPEMATGEQRTSFISDASRAFSSLPPDASQDDRDRALGHFITTYADQYNGSNGSNNPIAFNPHTAYLATAAAGLDDPSIPRPPNSGHINAADVIANGVYGGNLSAPDYQPRTVNLDPMALAGYAAGTRTILGASESYGYQLPAEAYDAARQATHELNAGHQDLAVQHYTRATGIATAYDEDPQMQGYESVRTRARDATGYDIGPYADRDKRDRGAGGSGGSASGDTSGDST